MFIKITAISSLLLIASTHTHAADITREVREGNTDAGGFLELGITAQTGRFPVVGLNDQNLEESSDTIYLLNASFQGRFEYKNFFGEIIEDSFSDVVLGYSLSNNDDFSLEIVATRCRPIRFHNRIFLLQ